MEKPNIRILILVNTIAFVVMLAVNTLSNTLPLNGKTPAQISDLYPNLFVPAGGTFSIWGIIYTWLLVFVIWQIIALFSSKHLSNISPIIQKLGWAFVLTCIFNVAWLFAWHWAFLWLSVLLMLGLFSSLIALNLQMGQGFSKINTTEKWLIHAPFGIYMGWISVATIANITAVLVAQQWTGWGLTDANWAFFMILAGTLIASFVLRKQNNLFYGLAVLWALNGIRLKRATDISAISHQLELSTSYAMIALLVVIVVKTRAWYKY